MRTCKETGDVKKRLLLISIAIIIVVLGVLGLHLFQREPVISEKQAIAKVKAHFGDDFYRVEKTELRNPTTQEASTIQSFGQKPPNLLWVVRVELNPFLLQTATLLIDAHTGEILFPIRILA